MTRQPDQLDAHMPRIMGLPRPNRDYRRSLGEYEGRARWAVDTGLLTETETETDQLRGLDMLTVIHDFELRTPARF